ncbi:hypothetical protein GCK32_001250 [Trichostrongylus colubriformis]|uniref:Uncharacterized protein n=1 Tax=Trichostrongylus colubriformis TaxID=6319 RepID=A0AAN8IWQ2_TRICO
MTAGTTIWQYGIGNIHHLLIRQTSQNDILWRTTFSSSPQYARSIPHEQKSVIRRIFGLEGDSTLPRQKTCSLDARHREMR